MKQKVICGQFRYCQRAIKPWLLMGYKITKAKRWSDGRYTYVLETNDDQRTFYVGHKPYTEA